ncbi:endo alpha-1,4 polygalactosaminidase [Streptomyces sp. NPDC015492]|uniref:endo alpha-1,4 polygalactosaminidase n=1 Tax=Streptomyces sp. NPDC015492 TaxID=3364958 RepID=UPI0036FA5A33
MLCPWGHGRQGALRRSCTNRTRHTPGPARRPPEDRPYGSGHSNWSCGSAASRRTIGFDFAVAEECGQYEECEAYAAAYANRVYVIEYTGTGYGRACADWGGTLSIVQRDLDVSAPGGAYRYRACCPPHGTRRGRPTAPAGIPAGKTGGARRSGAASVFPEIAKIHARRPTGGVTDGCRHDGPCPHAEVHPHHLRGHRLTPARPPRSRSAPPGPPL